MNDIILGKCSLAGLDAETPIRESDSRNILSVETTENDHGSSDASSVTNIVGDMTIRYDPLRRGRVIRMAVHLNEAQEDIKDGGS